MAREKHDFKSRPSGAMALRRYWALMIVMLVAVLDMIGRLVLAFDMARVVVIESVLFVGMSMLFALITTTYRGTSVLVGRVECWVGVAFGLAGVRAILLATGAGFTVVNFVMLGIGLAAKPDHHFFADVRSDLVSDSC